MGKGVGFRLTDRGSNLHCHFLTFCPFPLSEPQFSLLQNGGVSTVQWVCEEEMQSELLPFVKHPIRRVSVLVAR